jgi:cytochrome c oxidase subunit II
MDTEKNVLVILALILLGGAAYFGFKAFNGSNMVSNNGLNSQTATSSPVKEFNVVARRYSFEPATLTVNKGDHVLINVTTEDTKHGFAIDEFRIKQDINPGEKTVIEFTADKSGVFTYYCSIFCGSGHGDMKGRLIVN